MRILPFLFLSALSVYGQDHFSKAYHIKNDMCLVEEEGSLENPGHGSYSIRLHKWQDLTGWPAGDFYSGMFRPRDGTVEKVIFLNLDGKKDVVVTVRTIGTGAYLNADASAIEGKQLKLLASVKDLRLAGC